MIFIIFYSKLIIISKYKINYGAQYLTLSDFIKFYMSTYAISNREITDSDWRFLKKKYFY